MILSDSEINLDNRLLKKRLIIQSKNNNFISKSSSGGMFAELAKYVLSKNGVVFGCARNIDILYCNQLLRYFNCKSFVCNIHWSFYRDNTTNSQAV